MLRYYKDSSKSKSAASTRWRARLFPRPALTRRQILARRPAAHLSDADKAYLLGYEAAENFPSLLEHVYGGLADAALDQWEEA